MPYNSRVILLLLIGCGRPEPRPLPYWLDTAADTDTETVDDTATEETTTSPYLTELIVDGSFEDAGGAGWDAIGCAWAQDAGAISAYDGDWMLTGEQGDCIAQQDIDLVAQGFSAAEIDAGGVMLNAAGQLANLLHEDAFDDQSFARILFRDSGGALISTLESILGAGPAWTTRALVAGVPPGTRSLTVEVGGLFRQGQHNESAVDAVSVLLQQFSPEPATITLQPMLQDYRTDQMKLLWETDRADEPARIEWGAAGGPLSEQGSAITTVQVDTDRYVHRGVVGGLSAGERAAYRACVGEVCSATAELQAAPGDGAPVRVGWLADNQDNLSNIFELHLAHLQARSPDLVVMAGDVVQNGGDLDEWASLWWRPITDSGLGAEVPVLVARGNHDLENGYSYAYASMPGNGAWYSFRYGDVFFVVLDSNAGASSLQPAQSQANYLQTALARDEAKDASFRVVVVHAAPFNSVLSNTNPDAVSWGWDDGRDNLVPIFESADVDVVVAGHYHSYQRGERNGVRYLVIGGGGGSLLPDTVAGPYTEMWAHIEVSWHYALMDADQDTLTWTTYGVDDEPIDSFSLSAR